MIKKIYIHTRELDIIDNRIRRVLISYRITHCTLSYLGGDGRCGYCLKGPNDDRVKEKGSVCVAGAQGWMGGVIICCVPYHTLPYPVISCYTLP